MKKQSAIWSMVLIAVFALSFPLTLPQKNPDRIYGSR